MTGNGISIRAMSRSLRKGPNDTFSFRQLLNGDRGRLSLHGRTGSFSVIIYNMGLLVAPASYKGTDRGGALAELISRIKADPPDVVGLCEVFANDERNHIRSQLSSIYSHYREGPDEADLESDGGLLLLSQSPILASHNSIFRQCAGGDCFANKGVIFVRVQPAGCSTPWDIFLSHTQNIEEAGGESALYAQLTHLDHMVRAFFDPATPTLIMGDLNIPAEVQANYDQLLQRLSYPVDLWLVNHSSGDGTTFDDDNNFYEDRDEAPTKDSRLDYILLNAGSRFIPILKDMEILKWTCNGRQISDHYGLYVRFEQLIEVNVNISFPIASVRAIITGFRCIETTSGPGSDEVSFSIAIRDQHGRFVKTGSHTIEGVNTGEYHTVASMPAAVLGGDPGEFIDVTVEGTEHDTFSNNTMGIRTIRFSRKELMLEKGRSFSKIFPYLLSAGGEYGVEIRVWIT